MSEDWESSLSRWSSAGLLDAQTADSIRSWEKEHGEGSGGNRFAVIAFGLGGLLLVAGVLLFVASNWQSLSPAGRLILLAATVGVFHSGGAFASRLKPALATTLHAAGTGALGGAIFLSGQTFHLAENWPEGFLLWAIGAAAGLALLRDWPHAIFTAVLAPLWLWSELIKLSSLQGAGQAFQPAASFWVLLALIYLFASTPTNRPTWRKALSRLGAVALLPGVIVLAVSSSSDLMPSERYQTGPVLIASWVLALLLPLGLAYFLRRSDALYMLAPVVWVLAIGRLDPGEELQFLGMLTLFAAGSVGIVLWGLRDGAALSVNVGVAGFALSVLVFYFASDLFTKLGRSVGLIVAGWLFIGGGWILERTRRTIIGRIDEATT